jgi:hypothetical protein
MGGKSPVERSNWSLRVGCLRSQHGRTRDYRHRALLPGILRGPRSGLRRLGNDEGVGETAFCWGVMPVIREVTTVFACSSVVCR